MQEKIFLVEIKSLDNEDGCYANNAYFSKFFGLSKSRTSEVINSLVSKGWISAEFIPNEKGTDRILRASGKAKTLFGKGEGPLRETGRPPSGKAKHNNTFNNTKVLGEESPPEPLESTGDWNKEFITSYFTWYKQNNNNEDPKLDKGDYAGLKAIREYLAKSKKGDYPKALQAFEYILQNWAVLKDYRYLYTSRSPKQINSNLVNILPLLREHYLKVTSEKPKTRTKREVDSLFGDPKD